MDVVSTPAAEERTLRVLGARRREPPEPSSGELVRRLRQATQEDPSLVALFDAEAIAGERHLLSAWAHLGRSRRTGASRLRDRGAELALYVAGDDQLGRALAKVGVAASTEAFVLVAEKPRTLPELLDRFGLREDPSAYPRPPTVATLERLGVPPTERAMVPESAWEGLVLERVALVDLSSPSTGGAPPRAESASSPRRKG